MKNKIGIMGGTFNPIHNGHIILAQTAYNQVGLDKILFMPSGNSYMKNNVLDVKHRVNMTRLAIEPYSNFELSLIEVNRQGNTYTCDTLEELKNNNPENEYYFIMGADSLFQIETWRCPEKIFNLCTLICSIRDEHDKIAIYQKGKMLEDKFGAEIIYLDMPKIDISSTDIRNAIADKKSISDEVPYTVEEYIQKERLYSEKD